MVPVQDNDYKNTNNNILKLGEEYLYDNLGEGEVELPKELKDFDQQNINQFLKQNGFSEYCIKMSEQKLDGHAILYLHEIGQKFYEKLEKMNIPTGDALKIQKLFNQIF